MKQADTCIFYTHLRIWMQFLSDAGVLKPASISQLSLMLFNLFKDVYT